MLCECSSIALLFYVAAVMFSSLLVKIRFIVNK